MRTPLFLALCLGSSLAMAQSTSPGDGSFAFALGANRPYGILGDKSDNGFTWSMDFTYNVSKPFRLRTELGYSDNRVHTFSNLNVGASVYNWNLSENAVYSFNPGGSTEFYVIGGIGGYKVTGQLDQVVYVPAGGWWGWWGYYPANAVIASRSTTKLGYNAGIGVSFRTGSSVSVFLESRYTWIQTQQSVEYLPFMIGLRF